MDAGVARTEQPEAASGNAEFGVMTRDHLARVQDENEEVLTQVTDRMLDTCRDGGRIHTAGSGHSLALVMETFYRAGGLACVNPLYHPGLLPLHGAASSTVVERADGFASSLVAGAGPQHGDLAFVFSTSGTNALPVQLATAMRESGVDVVAVTSRAASAAAPTRSGHKLAGLADYVVDTGVRPGDSTYPPDAPQTGALSSITSVYLWQLLLSRLVDRAAEQGVPLPIWRSNNVVGGEEHNVELAERYRSRIDPL